MNQVRLCLVGKSCISNEWVKYLIHIHHLDSKLSSNINLSNKFASYPSRVVPIRLCLFHMNARFEFTKCVPLVNNRCI